MSRSPSVRIDKLLSSLGYGSRADILQIAKRCEITLDNTHIQDVTERVDLSPDLANRMTVFGTPLDPLHGMVVCLNKPLGFTCSHDDIGPLVYDLLPHRWRKRRPVISTIGRLDKETTGLLLMTDSGALIQRMTSPKHHIVKTYRVGLARKLNGDEAGVFASGTLLLKGEKKPLKPATLEQISNKECLITVSEGRYHQIRRMFAATGNHVESLHRERIGGFQLPTVLSSGQWQILADAEISQLLTRDATLAEKKPGTGPGS